MDIEDEIVVDARGHRCPVPTLRLRRAVAEAPAGSVLRLIADDPMARIDAVHFAGEAGLEVVSVVDEAGVLAVRVRKPL
ncbi:MAG TPA: sulfurtransferase TusA family protein [Caulobacteraceae bacterium]|jgi:tRNA 2-thiouridine synthesizing protein A|nr:sulfurtransferase TusA family protein [Caulobacteraceae bacterium]